jgi:large subunit ribosomal protein L23
MTKDPYQIIKRKHITEKTTTLGALQSAESNLCLSRCTTPKHVFIVDRNANKTQIASAIEEIYGDRKIKVTKVNTINMKPKARKYKGRKGQSAAFKKAIVSLEKGDTLEDL